MSDLTKSIAALDALTDDLEKAHHTKAHPGFESVANKIAKKEGVSKESAQAIVAASSRHASKSAKKHNPRLKKVGVVHKALTDLEEITSTLEKADSYLPGQIEMFGDAPPPPKPKKSVAKPSAHSAAAEASAKVAAALKAYTEKH